jgi:5-methylcytosine-specific restriction endonuclease McrA
MANYRDKKRRYTVSDVLLLNANAQPVSYLPLSAIGWKDAVTYMWLDKCVVLEWYDDWVVHAETWETKVPAVIMLREMMKTNMKPRFSKGNIFLRDSYTCQYCDIGLVRSQATLDHVLPTSRGGRTTWDNIVTSCGPCNHNKGNSLLPKPAKMPYKPDYYELVNKRKKLGWEVRHPEWHTYLQ